MREIRVSDVIYPVALRDLPTPPDPVWVDGVADVLRHSPAVAIVGTRRMTPYGERVARELAGAAASAGAVVVSGLAQGIDAVAHRAALDAGGCSIAVLGEGIAAFVAGAHGRRHALAARIREAGALVSQYPPYSVAQPWTFARRNATIAAFAVATVIVEAGGGSGALITAADARRLGRAVYAVPGPIGASASAGANALIAQGHARALLGPDVLVAALGLQPRASQRDRVGIDARILDALASSAATPDALAERVGSTADEIALRLASLVLAGDAVPLPDGRFALR